MGKQGKAVICREWNKPVSVETVSIESPRRGEVMIKVAACGVCHSDLSATNGTIPLPPPLVLGHEAAGQVVEVGEGVTDLQIGDPVVVSWVAVCGRCPYCVAGPARALRQRAEGGHDAARRNAPPQGFEGSGARPLRRCRRDGRVRHAAARERGQDRQGHPARQSRPGGLRRDDGRGRGDQHGEGRAGLDGGRDRGRRHRPQRDPGRGARWRAPDHRHRPGRQEARAGATVRRHALREPGPGRRRGGEGDGDDRAAASSMPSSASAWGPPSRRPTACCARAEWPWSSASRRWPTT